MVGVHGAGLATMIALQPGSAVVELFGGGPNKHFEYMASLLGHKHYSNGRHGGDGDPVWSAIKHAIDDVYAKRPDLRAPHDITAP
jgi:hypothetical protein